jgi:hypothetical protein
MPNHHSLKSVPRIGPLAEDITPIAGLPVFELA